MAHDLGKADDRIQRRAQLVAHMGQELAFRLVGVFGVLQSLPELLFRRQALADLVVEVRILALDDLVGAPNDDEENAVKQAKGPHQADGKPFLFVGDGGDPGGGVEIKLENALDGAAFAQDGKIGFDDVKVLEGAVDAMKVLRKPNLLAGVPLAAFLVESGLWLPSAPISEKSEE